MTKFVENNLKELYEILLNETNLGLIISDKEGGIVEANARVLDMLGSPNKELTLKINLFEFPELVRLGFSQKLEDALDNLLIYSGEGVYRSRWGKELYLKYTIYPVLIHFEKFAKVVIEDLTDLKNTKERYQKSEKILINSFNALEDLIIVIDRNYNIITSNWEDARALNLIGEENKCYNTFFASDSPCANCKLHQVFKSKQTVIYENHDSSDNFYEIKLIPIFDEDGEVEGIIEHYHDITLLRKNEIKLKKFKKVIENATESIVITDNKGKIEYVNPSFTRVTGYSSEEAVGRNPNVLKSGYHSQDFYKNLWETITMGKVWGGTFINKKKNGALYQEFANITAVFNQKREIINYISVKRDITKEVALQKQLMESQKLESIGILASGIAHEVNTPLQYIMDNLIFIKDNFKELSDYIDQLFHENKALMKTLNLSEEELGNVDFIMQETPEAIEDSLNGVNIIKSIINSMRLFARKSKDEEVIVDINKHIVAATEITRNSWKTNLDLKLNLLDDPPKIKANISKLSQVFMNLIINAIDAITEKQTLNKKNGTMTHEKDRLTISSYLKDNKLTIAFQDTGIGIDKENIDNIFTPFFTTKDVGKGTGQGLSISYNIIVNEHKGRLYFKTQKFKGTTFFIELPCLEGENGL